MQESSLNIEMRQQYEEKRGPIRSIELSDLLKNDPGFFEKYLVSILIGFILLCLLISYFVHYPEIVRAKFVLVSKNTPKPIIPKQEGRLIKIFVSNDQYVSKDSMIAFVETNASHEQVLEFKKFLLIIKKFIEDDDIGQLDSYFDTKLFDQLGSLQPGFQQLVSQYRLYKDYVANGYYLTRCKMLNDDINMVRKNIEDIQLQKNILKQDLKLTEENYAASLILLQQKVVSKLEERIERSKVLGKELNIEQMNSTIYNNNLQIREKQKEILEIQHSVKQQKEIFIQAILSLFNNVNEWVARFIISAPVDGKISFTADIQENSFVLIGKPIGVVSPKNESFLALINLNQQNSGKVHTGQNVQLQLNSYPFQEFGHVPGRIYYLNNVVSDSGILVKVILTNGLVTDMNMKIGYREGLNGEALIITKDLRLIERIYYNTIKNLKQ